MCGIAGVIDYSRGQAVDRDVVERMNATLTHRGPDDGGSWVHDRVGVAMRRLSIVDVARGHQPIANETGDCVIVFNGEIYNHHALRRQLEDRGHRFRTHTDTEAVLHLYEDEGEESVRRLDGMFAFAIVDLRSDRTRPRLFLARDRLGKKPLYYTDRNGVLVFGSELKAVLAHGGVSSELDIEAIHHYLSLLVVPEPFSIYRDVRKLPAGCTLTCDGEGVRLRRYWSLADVVGGRRTDRGRAAHDVRELLFAAVKKRLDLEVPFGAFLSGGLDSGSVVGIMSQILPRPVQTFSIGFEGPPSHNELPVAARTARHFQTDHHELLARPDVVSLLHESVQFADEPLAISSTIPLLLLAREARKDVKVVLTGDGGDEVFGGYSRYRFERWARLWRRLPPLVDRSLLAATAAVSRTGINGQVRRTLTHAERFLRNGRRPIGERRLGWSSGFDENEKHALCTGGSATWAHPPTPALIESRLAAYSALGPEAQVNAIDMLMWLPDEMLAKVDRMTMAASIEARSPLLDDALVDYMGAVSFHDKVATRPGSPAKAILRQAVADLLPPHLLSGRKWGFNVPLDDWFRGPAAPFVQATLSRQRLARRGLFDTGEVARLMEAHRRGHVNASNRLYALLTFEVWAEHHA
jgi:asparagine synthase (glutamine-hydrolysing)